MRSLKGEINEIFTLSRTTIRRKIILANYTCASTFLALRSSAPRYLLRLNFYLAETLTVPLPESTKLYQDSV